MNIITAEALAIFKVDLLFSF